MKSPVITLIVLLIGCFYCGQSQVILQQSILQTWVPAYTTTTSLDLSSKSIIYIDSYTFKYTPQAFTTLTLANNQLTTVTANVFINCLVLRTLNLANNKLTKIEPNAFNIAALTNSMTSLDLSYNYFTTLTYADILGLTNLTILKLNNNQLTDISNLFRGSSSYYTKLTHIYLNSNLLTTITASTFSLVPSLVYLYLNNNKIITIESKSFLGLVNLQFAFVGENPIATSQPLLLVQLCLTNPKCTICLYTTCSKLDSKLIF